MNTQEFDIQKLYDVYQALKDADTEGKDLCDQHVFVDPKLNKVSILICEAIAVLEG